MRCAVDDGCTIHDNTAKTKTSPLVLPEHEKEQTAPCSAGGLPPLWGMLVLAAKNNTHRSILSDKKHESSVLSMLARAVQRRGE